MSELSEVFLAKATESLAGAESEFVNGRYNNCANRCYYACFQAAISALLDAGLGPNDASGEWGHAFVQARFVGDLINRRKLYPVTLRETLSRALFLRQIGDYRGQQVTETQASRLARHARHFLDTVTAKGGSR
jgi:uncharacterized protein (UPF0332 family)